MKPTKAIEQQLAKQLKKNPFLKSVEIHEYFANAIKEYLDGEFEEYCTDDDYYPPVVEDFEIEYRMREWSKQNGFEFISCDGDGEEGEYEPKFTKGWY